MLGMRSRRIPGRRQAYRIPDWDRIGSSELHEAKPSRRFAGGGADVHALDSRTLDCRRGGPRRGRSWVRWVSPGFGDGAFCCYETTSWVRLVMRVPGFDRGESGIEIPFSRRRAGVPGIPEMKQGSSLDTRITPWHSPGWPNRFVLNAIRGVTGATGSRDAHLRYLSNQATILLFSSSLYT